ncbi:MAG: hypothetical protein RR559_12565, partial [Bacteroides sp.]
MKVSKKRYLSTAGFAVVLVLAFAYAVPSVAFASDFNVVPIQQPVEASNPSASVIGSESFDLDAGDPEDGDIAIAPGSEEG